MAQRLSGNDDERITAAIRVLETDGLPRQDPALDQLTDVLALATAAGCYDAADMIRRLAGRT